MSEVDGVVFGAGGGVGFECVKHLIEKGKSVRAVVRSPEKYKDKFPKNPLLTISKGGGIDGRSADVAAHYWTNVSCNMHARLSKYGSCELGICCTDVTDAASIKEVMQGAQGAIFAASGSTYWSASSVDYQVSQPCSIWYFEMLHTRPYASGYI